MRKSIPTHIVTGFLGSGKTTAILDLLARKPAAEKWAVLVNEFGEIGIDGAILAGSGAEIREVPGGCMCCVADLPMKVALNNLIVRAAPDRLLIEPSGLGHPQEIVDTLRGEYYCDVLDLRALIALVDPRKLSDPRYTDNQTFSEQLRIADVIVANKTDLSSARDKENFHRYIEQLPPAQRQVGWVSGGRLQLNWLDLPHHQQRVKAPLPARKNSPLQPPAQAALALQIKAGDEFARRENQLDGYYSCGWRFPEHTGFSFQHLMLLSGGLVVERLKAVLRTDRGCYVFNSESGVLSVNEIAAADNVIELIHSEKFDWHFIEQELLAARC